MRLKVILTLGFKLRVTMPSDRASIVILSQCTLKSGKFKSYVMMSTVSELCNRKWILMMTMRS